ncbi:tRNA (adenosine(37)-N6)-threonylcarbamoyltransferase complex dimerization subunit type 1 TsaB [Paracraurococcus lichenis]|uniref:tRNA (Adenosine(37)-N6)-threonylcarbamoyltransferase complex dimerization subunit type 1 TsaB n=1 Tax=Paracraurococcus lichenis TaxID=3064888 RepID=A0ABT9E1F2_9PROT|nr:tRNA (adenosine(37)-N6)-threonylcarbamoyltransferase complex dimerization subunit type 1 TsaB [Paracraurococcus sp. LOR1-02]MDO9709845.1 tRNA (adenosine(37)-N6)-threonylcarbamoyltransferase complex dimerization subunit type 1 TsaB [Paracraurococcus sp. LOR1-02]
MWILALDASLARCSAALLCDGALRAHRLLEGDRGHAALLPPMVQAVLREAGVRPADLDAVAAVVGPGGFTGIRAALALAQGLALAAGLPAIGVTTGEALAAALPPAGRPVWSAVDNRRGRVVLERFAAGAAAPEGPPAVFALADLPAPAGPVALVGDAASQVAEALAARGAEAVATESRQPDAAAAARVAALRLAGRIPGLAARPLYVEPPAVRLPATV